MKELEIKESIFNGIYSKVRVQQLQGIEYPGRSRTSLNCGKYKKAYICKCHKDYRVVRYICYRLTCPICYQKGIYRTSERLIYRWSKIRKMFKRSVYEVPNIYHWTINTMWKITAFNFKKYKKKLLNILKNEGLSGTLIFHAWRLKKGKMIYSPHWHYVGCGKLEKSDIFYMKHGFTYKCIRRIKSYKELRLVYVYILSHAGIVNGKHTIVWNNQFSYNRLSKINKKEDYEVVECGECGGKLFRIENKPKEIFGGLTTPMLVIYDSPLSLDLNDVYYEKIINYDLEYKGQLSILNDRLKNNL